MGIVVLCKVKFAINLNGHYLWWEWNMPKIPCQWGLTHQFRYRWQWERPTHRSDTASTYKRRTWDRRMCADHSTVNWWLFRFDHRRSMTWTFAIFCDRSAHCNRFALCPTFCTCTKRTTKMSTNKMQTEPLCPMHTRMLQSMWCVSRRSDFQNSSRIHPGKVDSLCWNDTRSERMKWLLKVTDISCLFEAE